MQNDIESEALDYWNWIRVIAENSYDDGTKTRCRSLKRNRLKKLGSTAAEWGMMPKIPKVKRAKGGQLMKGRSLGLEEFETMLLLADRIVGDEQSQSWKHYLRGLWLSGLRLAESLSLTWDDETKLRVDFSGRHPMIWIPCELQKSGRDSLTPITPDFASFLIETPEDERNGYVFNPTAERVHAERQTKDRVSRVIVNIGKKPALPSTRRLKRRRPPTTSADLLGSVGPAGGAQRAYAARKHQHDDGVLRRRERPGDR